MMKTSCLFFLLFAILLTNCKPNMDIPTPGAGEAIFTKSIALGGGFMAGYQDGALNHDGQERCIPALLARQFKLVGGGEFIQQLVPDNNGCGWNSKPWESWYATASKLNYKTDCQGLIALGPIKDSISRGAGFTYFANSFNNSNCNFSVPFATTQELFSPTLGSLFVNQNTNPFYHRIASNPGLSTAIEDARNSNATFFSAWLGLEDIYEYARQGGATGSIATPTSFSNSIDSILVTLLHNGAKGVIANIPDFRSFPFYTLVAYNAAKLTQGKADTLNDIYATAGLTNINFVQGNNGFVIEDANAPNGIRLLHNGEYITLGVPLDSVKCNYLGILFTTMPDRYVLDSNEVAFIDQMIAGYNLVIAQKATQYGLALVDANAYFKTLTSGIKWNGVNYNSQFVSGGVFSLDGYHPNQNGYALITNEFIKAINSKYRASIPTLNCTDCNGILFP